jgi:ABC-type phosphate/phosphonate transport system permease subunit
MLPFMLALLTVSSKMLTASQTDFQQNLDKKSWQCKKDFRFNVFAPQNHHKMIRFTVWIWECRGRKETVWHLSWITSSRYS